MLDRKDPRIRRIPFMTQKPTFNETRRVVGRLAAVNTNVIAEPTAEELTELAETKFIIAAKPKPAPEPVVEEPVEPELPEPELHVAARAGDAERVFALLIDSAADPTEVYRGKTPYTVSKTRETRDAFRRAMARMPEAWDWSGAAAVPSALTEDLEAKHAAKEAEYEAARKAKEKERKKAQKERKKKESSAAALLAKMTPPPPVEEPGAKKSAALVDKLDKAANDRREQMVRLESSVVSKRSSDTRRRCVLTLTNLRRSQQKDACKRSRRQKKQTSGRSGAFGTPMRALSAVVRTGRERFDVISKLALATAALAVVIQSNAHARTKMYRGKRKDTID